MIFNPLRYTASLIGISILISVVFYLTQRLFGFGGGSGASAVVPMVAAMIEGGSYFKRVGARPAGGAMWKAAFLMTIIAFVVSALVTVVMIFTISPDLAQVFDNLSLGLFALALGFVFLATWLMSRLGFGLGLNSQARAQK